MSRIYAPTAADCAFSTDTCADSVRDHNFIETQVKNYVENRPRYSGYPFERLFPDCLFPGEFCLAAEHRSNPRHDQVIQWNTAV
jgi:hypothetical protein